MPKTKLNKNKVFIAMWMADEYDPLLKAIKKALQIAGYEGFRINEVSHNKQIPEEVFNFIKKSPFIIVDFTYGKEGPRESVFFEAGYARAVGVEVIHTCEVSIVENLSFYTNQFTHIKWENFNEKAMKVFTKKLAKHIEGSIGAGYRKILSPDKKREGKIDGEVTSFAKGKDSDGDFIAIKVYSKGEEKIIKIYTTVNNSP